MFHFWLQLFLNLRKFFQYFLHLIADVNLYENNVSQVEANYFLMNEVKSSFTNFDPNAFSVLHLNIRSMKKKAFSVLHLNITGMEKNFKNVKEFLKNLSISFSAIWFSEKWCKSQDESQN